MSGLASGGPDIISHAFLHRRRPRIKGSGERPFSNTRRANSRCDPDSKLRRKISNTLAEGARSLRIGSKRGRSDVGICVRNEFCLYPPSMRVQRFKTDTRTNDTAGNLEVAQS